MVEHLKQKNFPDRGNIDGVNSLNGQNNLFAYRRLSHYPATFFVATPITNVHIKWWQQVRFTYLLLFLFVLGGIAVYRRAMRNQFAWETERVGHEEKFRAIYTGLLESEERFRRVADEAPFPMMIHAENGEVIKINKAWSEATGYTHADIPTISSWLKYAHGQNSIASEDVLEIKRKIERVYGINERVDQGEQVIRCKDGSMRTWHFSAAPVGKLPDGRRYVVSMAQDVSESRAAQQQIEFLAYHDALTKLPNRLLAKDHLEQAILLADREKNVVALLSIWINSRRSMTHSGMLLAIAC